MIVTIRDDVTDSYRYQTISRLPRGLDWLEDDLRAFANHGEFRNDLWEIVCELDERDD